MLVYSNKVGRYYHIGIESSGIAAHQMSHHRNSTDLHSLCLHVLDMMQMLRNKAQYIVGWKPVRSRKGAHAS